MAIVSTPKKTRKTRHKWSGLLCVLCTNSHVSPQLCETRMWHCGTSETVSHGKLTRFGSGCFERNCTVNSSSCTYLYSTVYKFSSSVCSTHMCVTLAPRRYGDLLRVYYHAWMMLAPDIWHAPDIWRAPYIVSSHAHDIAHDIRYYWKPVLCTFWDIPIIMLRSLRRCNFRTLTKVKSNSYSIKSYS